MGNKYNVTPIEKLLHQQQHQQQQQQQKEAFSEQKSIEIDMFIIQNLANLLSLPVRTYIIIYIWVYIIFIKIYQKESFLRHVKTLFIVP